MIYAALLRGINVGGNRKVEMQRLAATFERAGMMTVSTYINSGNVIFQSEHIDIDQLAKMIERAIESEFGFHVDVLLRDLDNIKAVIEALPHTWNNDKTSKCDVMYLWKDVDNRDVLNSLTVRPDIDEVKYVGGALLWRINREHASISGMKKLAGTALYKNMTIRNCNTTRKLHELMQAIL